MKAIETKSDKAMKWSIYIVIGGLFACLWWGITYGMVCLAQYAGKSLFHQDWPFWGVFAAMFVLQAILGNSARSKNK